MRGFTHSSSTRSPASTICLTRAAEVRPAPRAVQSFEQCAKPLLGVGSRAPRHEETSGVCYAARQAWGALPHCRLAGAPSQSSVRAPIHSTAWPELTPGRIVRLCLLFAPGAASVSHPALLLAAESSFLPDAYVPAAGQLRVPSIPGPSANVGPFGKDKRRKENDAQLSVAPRAQALFILGSCRQIPGQHVLENGGIWPRQ